MCVLKGLCQTMFFLLLCKVVWGQVSFVPCHMLLYIFLVVRIYLLCMLYKSLIILSRGFMHIMYYVYFFFLFACFTITNLYIVLYTLYYLTQPLLP